MSRARGVFAVAAAVAATAAPATGAQAATLELSTTRDRVSTSLGRGFAFDTTITNRGRKPLTGLVAHLNIVSLTRGVYVDPEDWSPRRTLYLPTLAPDQTANTSWTVDPVNGGRFAVYVVVVPSRTPSRGGLAASPAVDLRVAQRRTLNPDGVVPLVVGVPAVLGALALALRLRRRRS